MCRVLAMFPETARLVPIEHLVQLLPPLQPRLYSICSAPSSHRDQVNRFPPSLRLPSILIDSFGNCVYVSTKVEIGFSVLSYKAGDGSERKGVCTHFLSQVTSHTDVPIFIR